MGVRRRRSLTLTRPGIIGQLEHQTSLKARVQKGPQPLWSAGALNLPPGSLTEQRVRDPGKKKTWINRDTNREEEEQEAKRGAREQRDKEAGTEGAHKKNTRRPSGRTGGQHKPKAHQIRCELMPIQNPNWICYVLGLFKNINNICPLSGPMEASLLFSLCFSFFLFHSMFNSCLSCVLCSFSLSFWSRRSATRAHQRQKFTPQGRQEGVWFLVKGTWPAA